MEQTWAEWGSPEKEKSWCGEVWLTGFQGLEVLPRSPVLFPPVLLGSEGLSQLCSVFFVSGGEDVIVLMMCLWLGMPLY